MLHILQRIVSNLDWLVRELRQTTGAENRFCVWRSLKRANNGGVTTATDRAQSSIKVNRTQSRLDDLSKYGIALSQRPAILISEAFVKCNEPSKENMLTEHW